MKKTRYIANLAIKICVFAALLSQAEKECGAQSFFFQDNAILSQEEGALPQDDIDLSQIQEILMLDDFVLPQNEETSSSQQNSCNAQKICDDFIAIENVEVLVDNIREEHIERQIKEIASADINNFIAKAKLNASELGASIVVRQRSYYKNMQKRNSIYVYYSVFEKSGKRMAEDWFVVEGKASIISAAIQVRRIKKAVRGMKRNIRKYGAKSGETFVAKR